MKTYTFSRTAKFEVTLTADIKAETEAEAKAKADALPDHRWTDYDDDVSLNGAWAQTLGPVELEYVPED